MDTYQEAAILLSLLVIIPILSISYWCAFIWLVDKFLGWQFSRKGSRC